MGLIKLISNRIGSEWKKAFNDNIDYLDSLEKKQEETHGYINKRIDNLVLHSGGESPNEVTDGRINNEGNEFDTLQGRLITSENKYDTAIQGLNAAQGKQKAQLDQLNEVIRALYNSNGASVSIYVSADRGSDVSGDGTEDKPFRTIQMAVNQIPVINSSSTTIFVDAGVYLEDVKISNVISPVITIRSINPASGGANETVGDGELSVKVRSIWASNCNSRFQIYGIQFVDQKNTMKLRYFGSIAITDAGSMTIEKCAFREDTQNISGGHRTIQTAGNASLHIMRSDVKNQNIVFYADTGSELRVGGNNSGKDNNIVAVAENSTLRTNSGISGTIATQAIGAGLIITKGTVI